MLLSKGRDEHNLFWALEKLKRGMRLLWFTGMSVLAFVP